MTERNVSGNARTKYAKAKKLAENLGVSAADLDAIAEGVREFDRERDAATRQAKALEKLVETFTSQHKGGQSENGYHAFEERRMRRREVYAQELFAVALYEDDPDGETMTGIRESYPYKRLIERLKGPTGDLSQASNDAPA